MIAPTRWAAAALGVAIACGVALTVVATGANAATTTLCALQTAPAMGGAYTVQNNEWGSSASECINTDGNADFTVANSAIANSTSGAPGGYASIYKGCHWGACTQNSGFPLQVSTLHPGAVTSSWSTTQPGSGAYDVAYDIWFNQTPTTPGQPNGTELMIWLNHNGPVQPFGSKVATTTVNGVSYDVWFGTQGWNTVSYTMSTATTSVSNLDIDALAADAVSRGYLQNSWFLIDVEAGFEMWQGGAGLATNSFSVNANGGGTNPPPTTTTTTTPPTTTGSAGGAGCSAAYSVANSWAGGFQAGVTVTNTGTAPIHGWSLGWTFPGDQKISNMWGASDTQTGAVVKATNASYDGALAPGTSAMLGFTATSTSGSTSPTISCTTN
ncbi:MAG TPA: cellulose binding domain-containing protein [Pseudonocardiaceae bacterium]|nr:cellulose binding domain-containing protein [Pseudonocardiaceae bacterium]